MTEVEASKQLPSTTRLWRYLSLDKLVDLVSTRELFFAPLAAFAQSDPFEGYLPSVAFDAHASLSSRYVNDTKLVHQQVAEYRRNKGFPLTDAEQLMLETSIEDMRSSFRRLLPAIAKATTVNCWHANEGESEAMWRLYGENGKAVVVETTLEALTLSIQQCDSPHAVFIYPIKYLDFFDTTLQPKDCVVEGHLMPLLKRISYQHEREVRAFISKIAPNPRAGADVAFWKPESIRLPVDVNVLVKAIHVSPYAREPFPSSVVKICEAFGLSPRIVQPSQLLTGEEQLLERLSV